jgi:CDP-diacylglycerol pyrophosphatase
MTPNRSDDLEILLKRADIALHYLERLSADSIWAHRASGLRGSLYQALQVTEAERNDEFFLRLKERVELAYWMLKNAAMEIPDPEDWR